MSGIFGIVDPRGVTEADLLQATAQVPFRAEPRYVHLDRITLGWFDEPFPEEISLDQTGDITTLVEGRVDGSVRDPMSDPPSAPAAAFLAAQLHGGLTRLQEVAANFALASADQGAGTLLLARDAFGTRPLYWARRGERFAFSSDPEFLIRLGVASSELDPRVMTVYLRLESLPRWRTAFRDVARVPNGHWLRLVDNELDYGRWFRPEETGVSYRTVEEASEDMARLLPIVVASQVRGSKPLLSLSSGRDSASVAAALAAAGMRVDCVTYDFERHHNDADERRDAQAIASSFGHPWRTVPVTDSFDDGDLALIAQLHGSPIGFPAFPLALAVGRAGSNVGADLLLDGMGGEPLFSASPIVVLDLLRSLRFREAARAAVTFDRLWTYSYWHTTKSIARSLAPSPVLRWRDRTRRQLPWSAGTPSTRRRQEWHTAREHLLLSVTEFGRSGEIELAERFYRGFGLRYACPLLDLRVVRLALRLPSAARAPVPVPKPVLAEAFLRGVTCRKARQTSYFEGLAGFALDARPDLFDSRSVLARRGVVRVDSLRRIREKAWRIHLLALIPVEAWLRQEDLRDGAEG